MSTPQIPDPLPTVEPIAQLILPKGNEIESLQPISNSTQDDMLIWVKVLHTDVWEIITYLWPELLSIILIILGFTLIILWFKKRNKLRDVKVGEPYCKKCCYVIDQSTSVCPECGKKLNHKIPTRRKWQCTWTSLLFTTSITWGIAIILISILSYQAFSSKRSAHMYGSWKSSWTSGSGIKHWFDWRSQWLYGLASKLPQKYARVTNLYSRDFQLELRAIKHDKKTNKITQRRLASINYDPYVHDSYAKKFDRFQGYISNHASISQPLCYSFNNKYLVNLADQFFIYDNNTGNVKQIPLTSAQIAAIQGIYELGNNLIALRQVTIEETKPSEGSITHYYDHIQLLDLEKEQIIFDDYLLLHEPGKPTIKATTLSLDNVKRDQTTIFQDLKLTYVTELDDIPEDTPVYNVVRILSKPENNYYWTHLVDNKLKKLDEAQPVNLPTYEVGRPFQTAPLDLTNTAVLLHDFYATNLKIKQIGGTKALGFNYNKNTPLSNTDFVRLQIHSDAGEFVEYAVTSDLSDNKLWIGFYSQYGVMPAGSKTFSPINNCGISIYDIEELKEKSITINNDQ
ncbi:hypothetical protein JD969_13090 [Planctomycetota bacterium]|nr:hypothetical protein JD969_13090 [Planctomycetota bacterium]